MPLNKRLSLRQFPLRCAELIGAARALFSVPFDPSTDETIARFAQISTDSWAAHYASACDYLDAGKRLSPELECRLNDFISQFDRTSRLEQLNLRCAYDPIWKKNRQEAYERIARQETTLDIARNVAKGSASLLTVQKTRIARSLLTEGPVSDDVGTFVNMAYSTVQLQTDVVFEARRFLCLASAVLDPGTPLAEEASDLSKCIERDSVNGARNQARRAPNSFLFLAH